jgi:mersacidin/lichenicidin family type 2 lantibiotic
MKESVMSHVNVIRAWKDEEYRNSLSEAERAALPENPAGLLDLTETELQQAEGGFIVRHTFYTCFTIYHCFLTIVGCPTVLCV